jgi:hypothetical protein
VGVGIGFVGGVVRGCVVGGVDDDTLVGVVDGSPVGDVGPGVWVCVPLLPHAAVRSAAARRLAVMGADRITASLPGPATAPRRGPSPFGRTVLMSWYVACDGHAPCRGDYA